MPGVENVVADALSQPLAVTAMSVAVSGFRHLKSLGVRHILVITLAVSGFRHLKSSGVRHTVLYLYNYLCCIWLQTSEIFSLVHGTIDIEAFFLFKKHPHIIDQLAFIIASFWLL